MRLLLDEIYPSRLAEELRAAGIDAVTVAKLHLIAAPDADVFAAGVDAQRAVVTKNVADFTRIAAAHSMAGGHHPDCWSRCHPDSHGARQVSGRSFSHRSRGR